MNILRRERRKNIVRSQNIKFFIQREDVDCIDGAVTKGTQYSIQKNLCIIGSKSINECDVWLTY